MDIPEYNIEFGKLMLSTDDTSPSEDDFKYVLRNKLLEHYVKVPAQWKGMDGLGDEWVNKVGDLEKEISKELKEIWDSN